MVELITPPDPQTLLPPLLACIPTAFVSPRPPPALLPLLSPILRQRVQIFSDVASSAKESWLQYLCWDNTKAERLQSLVDGASFEPHPVSGEIELQEDTPVSYKRIDDETLQSRILVPEYSLNFVFLWCPNDQEGGGPGWRVAELLPLDNNDSETWSISIGEANFHAKEKLMEDALNAAEKHEIPAVQEPEQEEDDDADYWAQYDATPGRTPSVKTPAPNPMSSLQQNASESSYFSRYADVQPAMDNHDPEEEQPELGPSSLNGDMLASLLQRQMDNATEDSSAHANGHTVDEQRAMALNHPRPSSASSTGSVAKLEQEAENQSACEIGVKQHISSNIKSLFRLAKATGLSRGEFQSLVRNELELLNVSDDDD